MYAKSLIVVALCTAFVLSFALVLNYEAAGIGKQATTIAISRTTCPASEASCERLAIASATLRTVNYTDELGAVTYSNLSARFTPFGPSPVESVDLYFGNASSTTKVYSVQGPFEPGVGRVLTVTLPSSVVVTPGKTYPVTIEVYSQSNLTVSVSMQVTAQRGLSVQTLVSAPLNTEPTHLRHMHQGLVSALDDVASWLQFVSQAVPISQLSLMTWVIFIISGCFDAGNAFNVPEQSTGPLSKAPFQKANGEYLWR